jgi:hypothetical protein
VRSDRPAKLLRRRSWRLLGVLVALAAAGPLAGCSTTYQKAARLQLNSRRIVLTGSVTRVGGPSRTVRARDVAVVRDGGRVAVVVNVVNEGRSAVSDLPIAVGYRLRGHHVRYINIAAGGQYFDSHLPPLRAGQQLVWVLSPARSLPRGARPVVVIGSRPATHSEVTLTHTPVRLKVDNRGSSLSIAVTNLTGVEQENLLLYAYVKEAGRYRQAGSATITELDPGASERMRLALVGGGSTSAVRVDAVPTILQ